MIIVRDVGRRVPEISKETMDARMKKEVDYEIVFNKKVVFDLDLAQKFIEMPTFTAERKLVDHHVDYLVNEAKRGTYLWETASLMSCDCLYDGIERRLDGHHTSWMRTFLPDEIEGLRVTWIKYSVKTENDYRLLYAAINRELARTPKHVIQTLLFDTEKFEGMSKQLIGCLQTGYRIFGDGKSMQERKKLSIDKIAATLKTTQHSLAIEVGNVIVRSQSLNPRFWHMKRAPVYGAMFATCSKNREMSRQFWGTVADGLDLGDTSDPRHRLRDFLLRSSVNHAAGSKKGDMVVTAEAMYNACVHMWNAHRGGEMVKVLRVPEKRPVPV